MLNHITIMGRMVRDPELRQTQSGVSVCSFTLACDRDFKSGDKKETDFIDCVAWRSTAEFITKYFAKGRMAVVSGRLQIRDWTDRDGGKRRSAEIVLDNAYFGDSKTKDSQEPPAVVHSASSGFPDSTSMDSTNVPPGFPPFDTNGFPGSGGFPDGFVPNL